MGGSRALLRPGPERSPAGLSRGTRGRLQKGPEGRGEGHLRPAQPRGRGPTGMSLGGGGG